MNPPPEPLSLEIERCRERQGRLVKILHELSADRAVLSLPEHVQYLTSFRPHPLLRAVVALDADGYCTLVKPNEPPEGASADTIVPFEAQWHSTLRQEQLHIAAGVLKAALRDRPEARRVAVELSSLVTGVNEQAELVDIEPELWKLRRKKDDDEMAMIGRAISCTEAMYARAREIIEPGISELEVFGALHAAAVEVAGEPLTALGNDYQCCSPGGPPRPRAARDGELFVLDLGPAYRGYHADNCRTFAVGSATDEQLRAWEAIVATLAMVEREVRPGVSCREMFEQAQRRLDTFRPGAFSHHLGHGIGLYPHEAPHLNPHWNDTFEEGDVFTAEPGLYGPELRAGIRLEQNYRVTATGVERLTSFPLEL